jgi:hypothetical protein
MRDYNKIAEKMDKLWSGGKYHPVKPVKPAQTTDKLITEAMDKFQKGKK